ncbi:MAG: hypothetical protein HC902_07140 [Calothrix sp. SM1_5_4]|nr:hypothetical protein [Calothrix sp. SM1_5_4]
MPPKQTGVYLGMTAPEHTPDGYKLIRGTPTWLVALVLNAQRPGIFRSKENRQALQSALRNHFSRNEPRLPSFQATNSFYPLSGKGSEIEAQYKWGQSSGQKLRISYSRELPNLEKSYIENAIRASLPTGVSVEFPVINRNESSWLDNFLEMKNLDGRIQLVDIGGHMMNAAISMMFCSKLGVRFPDSSGRICDLVAKAKSSDSVVSDDYEMQFNSILKDEAEVIPLFSTGIFWLYSDDIDPKSISSIPLDPRFDLLRLRP